MTAHDAPLPTLIDGASAAMARGDWPAAFGHWEHIRLRHREHAEAHLNAALALLRLGHVAQADALLLHGATAFPDHVPLALECARNAFRSGDWTAALERWRAVMDRFPDSPDAFAGVGASLQLLGHLDDAEPILAEAAGRFPNHVEIAIELARVPHRRADWPAALARWSDVVRRFPDHPEGYAGAGVALQLLDRLDEADVLLRGAADRFPAHWGIAIEYARIPHRRADWQAALQRWRAVIERCPDAPDGPIGAGIALRQLKQFDESDSVFTEAMARFPDNLNLRIEFACVASERLDWEEARRRWQTARTQFPDDQSIKEALSYAMLQLQLATAEGTEPPNAGREPVATGPNADAANIMMQFESLGSGCEFGLVQRHFDIEPLGLLRWGAISADRLAEALDSRFEGVGAPEQTMLFEVGDEREYFFRDRRFSLEMHTFIRAADANYGEVLTRQARRARYLREKLLNDLDEPAGFAKIFVYKPHFGTMPQHEIVTLHKALRRRGRHVLLVMQSADATHPNETIEAHADGLLMGYVEGLLPLGHTPKVHHDSWLVVCTKALALRQQHFLA